MTAQAQAAHPAPARIADVMSTPVLTVETGETLWDAWQLMFVSGLRHLVVVDASGSCAGIITDRMIVTDLPSDPGALGQRRIDEVFAGSVELRVTPDAEPRSAAAAMRSFGVEAVPVVDDAQRVVGLVTESDLVRWMVQ